MSSHALRYRENIARGSFTKLPAWREGVEPSEKQQCGGEARSPRNIPRNLPRWPQCPPRPRTRCAHTCRQ